jgi:hypothetical protein
MKKRKNLQKKLQNEKGLPKKCLKRNEKTKNISIYMNIVLNIMYWKKVQEEEEDKLLFRISAADYI